MYVNGNAKLARLVQRFLERQGKPGRPLQAVGHVAVPQVPGGDLRQEHRAVIGFGALDDPCVLFGVEEFLAIGAAAPGQGIGRAPLQRQELGDGLLGTYGVDAILDCEDIRRALTGVVLSANDPVAAWGGVKLLRERFKVDPCMVTGPATDNQVGVDIIVQQMNVAACNAISNPAMLGDAIIKAVGLESRAAAAVASE